MMPSKINSVISVCCADDIKTWSIASNLIIKYITANKYKVIVPDSQIDIFKEHTNKLFEIIPESTLIPYETQVELKKILIEEKKSRFNWYFQQYLKLIAIQDGDDEDVNLIWDADTVPLKNLEFINSNNKVCFYKAREHGPDYFKLIEKVLGLKKKQNFSFIAQCLPTKVKWAKECLNSIETNSNEKWMYAISKNIVKHSLCGFSEYETLGTYIYAHHFNDVHIYNNKWFRYGISLIGGINNLSERKISELATKYDFIAFEKWDNGKKLGFNAWILRMFFLLNKKKRWYNFWSK